MYRNTVRKGTGQLEDIFMQTVPVEYSRVARLHAVDPRAHVSHGKVTRSKKGKNGKYCPNYAECGSQWQACCM